MRFCVLSECVLLIGLLLVLAGHADAQQTAIRLWLRGYGEGGAVEYMSFGHTSLNTFGVDSLQPGEFKELEPPPPGPGFDCIWIPPPGRGGQWGSYRGLLRRDWRDMDSLLYSARQDTWMVRFAQNDNSLTTISFAWPDAQCLLLLCDSIFMIDPTHQIARINMFDTDTLDIPEAGERGIKTLMIVKYTAKAELCESGPCVYTCGIDGVDGQETTPPSPALSENYPNPFNPQTIIQIQAGVREMITLKIYDVLGRELTTVFEGYVEPGIHKFAWNADAHASGVYIARLTTIRGSSIQKLVLTR